MIIGKKFFKVMTVFCILASMMMSAAGAGRAEEAAEVTDDLSVVVFIPGVVAGSPPYEALVRGAEQTAQQNDNLSVRVYEAGFNQAEWEEKVTSLAASGMYDIILTSNPSLPEIFAAVAESFPAQKFIAFDADYPGNDQIVTYLYNQYEQSLYLGYLAGLVSSSDMPNANAHRKVGFVAAQEYPMMNNLIMPGFIDGARMVDESFELDTRIIGNWFDASRAAELANSMIDAGVDVFAVIAGGAGQGVIQAASDRGAYVVFHNTDVYDLAPGVIIGCGSMEQEKLTVEVLESALRGDIEYGKSFIVDAANGYLDFFGDEPGYTEHVSDSVRAEFDAFMDDIRSGAVPFETPSM